MHRLRASQLRWSTATDESPSKIKAPRRALSARADGGLDDASVEVVRAARAAGLRVVEPAVPEDRWVTVNGIRFHYLDWGNERLPGLVFLHGFAQQAHSWDFAALALRHRFHAVSFDLRGHGDSGWSPDGLYSLERHVADVEALIPAAGLTSHVVCGLSMGGRIAYMYASRGPAGLRSLIVAEAAPETQEAGRRAVTDFTSGASEFDTFEDIVARALAYNPRRTPEQARGSLRHSVRQRPDGKWSWKWDPALRQARSPSSYDPQEQWAALSRVRCPTLFVVGEQSGMVAQETLRRMVAAVPGSTVETIKNAGHLVAGDNPARFDAVVQRFLRRAGALRLPE